VDWRPSGHRTHCLRQIIDFDDNAVPEQPLGGGHVGVRGQHYLEAASASAAGATVGTVCKLVDHSRVPIYFLATRYGENIVFSGPGFPRGPRNTAGAASAKDFYIYICYCHICVLLTKTNLMIYNIVTMAYVLSSETSHVTLGPPLSAEGKPANLIDASSPVQLYRTA